MFDSIGHVHGEQAIVQCQRSSESLRNITDITLVKRECVWFTIILLFDRYDASIHIMPSKIFCGRSASIISPQGVELNALRTSRDSMSTDRLLFGASTFASFRSPLSARSLLK